MSPHAHRRRRRERALFEYSGRPFCCKEEQIANLDLKKSGLFENIHLKGFVFSYKAEVLLEDSVKVRLSDVCGPSLKVIAFREQ